MATFFEVFLRENDPAAAVEAFREIDRLEQHLSRFISSSDISQLNAKSAQAIPVSPDTFECLQIAQHLYVETSGAFDITYESPGSIKMIQLGEQHGLPPLHVGWGAGGAGANGGFIDLGGIGKGYAVDRAIDVLKEWGLCGALVNSGTSTVAAFSQTNELWPVAVGGPWGEAAGCSIVKLRNGAVSGSGPEVKGNHVIDPRTGQPATHHAAAWSRCQSAAVADALSTAFMVMTTEEVQTYCAKHPEVDAMLAVGEPDGIRLACFNGWANDKDLHFEG